MGYESRLFVAERRFSKVGNAVNEWFEILATIELCKAGFDCKKFDEVFDKKPISNLTSMIFGCGVEFECDIDKTDHSIKYEYKDCYGDIIKYGNIKDVRNFIADMARETTYRRFDMAIGVLDSFINLSKADFDELVVFHYGH